MQYSISVEHALHSLFYMIELPEGRAIGIKRIAEIHNLQDAYLSKIFSKLSKAGVVRSTTGINGGYLLAKDPKEISFWDVIEAIEGTTYFFRCINIKDKNIFNSDTVMQKKSQSCLIKDVMQEAEDLYRDYLKSKSLLWLYNSVRPKLSNNTNIAIKKWLETF